MKIYAIIMLLILFYSPFYGLAYDENETPKYIKISESFFPVTKTWQSIETLPLFEKVKDKNIRQQLTQAFGLPSIDNELSRYVHTKASPIASEIFAEEYHKYFRKIDINLDGLQDVIYTGPISCQEGHITIVWLESQNGFLSKPIFWPTLILKILPGNEVLVSSIDVGCCASLMDTYHIGDLLINFRMRGAIMTKKDTFRPTNLPAKQIPFKSAKELTLRNSPEVSDKFIDWMSDRERNAVFGNILAKYIAGATGTVITEQKDSKNVMWAYVIVSDASNMYRYHNPFSVNVGWAKASSIIVDK